MRTDETCAKALIEGVEMEYWGNKTVSDGYSTSLYFHQKKLAMNYEGEISVSDAGYRRNVTRRRINAILTLLGYNEEDLIVATKARLKENNRFVVWKWKQGEEFPFNKFIIVSK